jgi:hypothetical protein
MKFKVTTSNEAINESTQSSYMSKSGIYPVSIQFASLDVTASGAESVNFNFLYNGEAQTVYGPFVTNRDGEVNSIGAKIINKLAVIAGMTEGDDFEIEEETHAVGKDKKEQEFAVITNFTGVECQVRLQEEYSINPKTKEIQKRMVIKNFFAANGASAAEIVNETTPGADLEREQKYASNVTYKDDLDPDSVAAWRESKKSGTATTPKPKATAKPAAKAGSLFK